jgi:hypothetical protein
MHAGTKHNDISSHYFLLIARETHTFVNGKYRSR